MHGRGRKAQARQEEQGGRSQDGHDPTSARPKRATHHLDDPKAGEPANHRRHRRQTTDGQTDRQTAAGRASGRNGRTGDPRGPQNRRKRRTGRRTGGERTERTDGGPPPRGSTAEGTKDHVGRATVEQSAQLSPELACAHQCRLAVLSVLVAGPGHATLPHEGGYLVGRPPTSLQGERPESCACLGIPPPLFFVFLRKRTHAEGNCSFATKC